MFAIRRPKRALRWALAVLLSAPSIALASSAGAIPATPLMTVYQFDGPLAAPYYDVDRFVASGATSPTGTLVQGSAVIPCLVLRAGKPVTDESGTPYVGFEIVVDAKSATPESSARFAEVSKAQKALAVANHHCPEGTRSVIDVRKLAALDKAPSFDPPRPAGEPVGATARSELDAIVRAFHASRHCESVNQRLTGRRDALGFAWSSFIAENAARRPTANLERARQLDYVMRTAIYEGHLGRGCGAYGACERNAIALSIRNRAVERCLAGQGCRTEGDFEGVASTVSQYNIWDELLTQTSGLTSCFLRPDLAAIERYARLQAIYEQSVGDVERILYGGADDLSAVFPGNSLAELTELRHYYHPPAMGKCFPGHPRIEYMTGAVARSGASYALIANTRIEVGGASGADYFFQEVIVEDDGDRDVVRLADRYPGFAVDGRKIELARSALCTPYGTPRACRFAEIGRHRKTPTWLASGRSLELGCRVRARGTDCRGEGVLESVKVGGICDKWMQPVAGVP